MRRYIALAGVLTLFAASYSVTCATPRRVSSASAEVAPNKAPDTVLQLEPVSLSSAVVQHSKPKLKAKAKSVARKAKAKAKAKAKSPTIRRVAAAVAGVAKDTTVYPIVKCWNGTHVTDHPGVQDCPSRPAPKPGTSPSGSIPAVWERLVACEANGDWRYGGPGGHTDPGYGEFEGGPNFVHSTWTGYGGRQYAEHAWGATPYEQIEIARKVLASEGVHAWPVCGPRAGLQQGD